jgi:hypothetical protein
MSDRLDPVKAERLSRQVVERLLVPLVIGGELRPLSPFGVRRAKAYAKAMRIADGELGDKLALARLSLARSLCPIDELPEPSAELWLLVFALNDLLQVTHPELSGAFRRDPQLSLLAAVQQTIDAAGAPATLAEALARHTVFARVFELVRFDEHVSWWTGSATFVGTRAPARLLAWPRLRRVDKRVESVALVELAPSAGWAAHWLQVVARWVRASPLTDLMTASRKAPPFVWSGAALGLVNTAPGRVLAMRAIDRQGEHAGAVTALRRAAPAIEIEAGVRAANDFADELEQIQRLYQQAL